MLLHKENTEQKVHKYEKNLIMYHTKIGKITVSHIWSYAKGTPLINETGAERGVGDTKSKIKSNQVDLSSITRGVVTQSPEPEWRWLQYFMIENQQLRICCRSGGRYCHCWRQRPTEDHRGRNREKQTQSKEVHCWLLLLWNWVSTNINDVAKSRVEGKGKYLLTTTFHNCDPYNGKY